MVCGAASKYPRSCMHTEGVSDTLMSYLRSVVHDDDSSLRLVMFPRLILLVTSRFLQFVSEE